MEWLKEKLLDLLGPRYIDTLANAIAKALAGALGAYGVSQASSKEVILGVLMFALSLLRSFLRNKSLLNELPPAAK